MPLPSSLSSWRRAGDLDFARFFDGDVAAVVAQGDRSLMALFAEDADAQGLRLAVGQGVEQDADAVAFDHAAVASAREGGDEGTGGLRDGIQFLENFAQSLALLRDHRALAPAIAAGRFIGRLGNGTQVFGDGRRFNGLAGIGAAGEGEGGIASPIPMLAVIVGCSSVSS
jgi:hypothetical protein